MKKILLTLFVGVGFATVAIAQEPAKVAKKKAAGPALVSTADAEKLKAKKARAVAIESGKPDPASKSRGSKTSTAVERAN